MTVYHTRAVRSAKSPMRYTPGIVHRYAEWLAQTSFSLTIQTHEWMIPTIQSIHIVAIGVALGSAFMVALRLLGWAARDQTLVDTIARFGPWLAWALCVLLATGALMVVGEPARELLAFSFWLKMALVAVAASVATVFRRSVRRHDARWETALLHAPRTKAITALTLVVWAAIVVLGRLIAYDYVWGSWSTILKP
jgi:hypothetical protein